MEKLGLTETEAEELIAYDNAVDKGETTEYDLTPEQKKIVKQYTNVGTKEKSSKPVVRERKANPTKANIIAEIAKFLQENSVNACENVEITNKERQIAFQIGENSYEITLIQKRKPKN